MEHDAVIFSDGGPAGRKSYEIYDHGALVASRPSLTEAKSVISERWSTDPAWRQMTLPGVEAIHYHFGPTTEFTSPTIVWVATRGTDA